MLRSKVPSNGATLIMRVTLIIIHMYPFERSYSSKTVIFNVVMYASVAGALKV